MPIEVLVILFAGRFDDKRYATNGNFRQANSSDNIRDSGSALSSDNQNSFFSGI